MGNAIAWIVSLALLAALYMLPTFIAYKRQHNVSGVAIVNVLLGWSIIGWVIALVMACGARHERAA